MASVMDSYVFRSSGKKEARWAGDSRTQPTNRRWTDFKLYAANFLYDGFASGETW